MHDNGSMNVACFVIFRIIPNYLNFNKVQEIYRTLFQTNFTKCPGFLGGSDSKESACNTRDLGSIPGLGRSPGEGHGNPLQYPCLGNPMKKGALWAAVHGAAKSHT